MKTIYFAGGCFWGVEAFFKRIPGVLDTCVGYANGHTENPSYEQVCTKTTGHAETVKVQFDENIVGLNHLMEKFFSVIDPTVLDRQGPDIGNQYRTGIYFENPDDEKAITEFINKMKPNYEKPIVTECVPISCFYPAEEYHQDYLDKNPRGYCHIPLD